MAVRAKEPFSFDAPGGAQVNIRRGQLFPDGHPYLKGRENLFEPADDAAARSAGTSASVETATAAPGERRTITRKPRTED